MTTIIGLGHRARQGKDTLAELIQHRLRGEGARCRVYSFAAHLKAVARQLGMKGKDPKALQLLGDAMRRFDQDVFVKQAAQQVDDDGCDFAIIPDLRRLNEMHWIRSQGGLVVKVQRLENGVPFVARDRDGGHPSEKELEDEVFDDYVMAESGDLEALGLAARWVAERAHDRRRV